MLNIISENGSYLSYQLLVIKNRGYNRVVQTVVVLKSIFIVSWTTNCN